MTSEAAQTYRKTDLRANSSLVIINENRVRTNEPTGEPESLAGKIGKGTMGDRAQFTKPSDMLEAEKREKAAKSRDIAPKKAKRGPKKLKVAGPKNVLQATEVIEQGLYRPKTKETKVEYEKLLSFMQQYLGDQPQDVLKGAADETLAVMKNDKLSQPERKIELEHGLFDSLTEDAFTDLTQMCQRITDYAEKEEEQTTDTAIDEETGVAVVFDEEEEDDIEDESDTERVVQEDVADEDLGEDTTTAQQLTQKDEDEEMGDAQPTAQQEFELDPSEIDAFWLQRKIREFEKDAVNAQSLAEKVMASLHEADQRQLENQLVMLLGFERFSLIKLLLQNRDQILFCTRLAKAENDTERQKVEEDMSAHPVGLRILQQLKKAPISKGDAQLKAKLKAERAEGEDSSKVRKVLDLDSITFMAGGHLMSNKQCKLPEGSFRTQKKGYEEIHVPKPVFPASDKTVLIPISTLPKWVQPMFPNVERLTFIQSKLFESAFYKADNLLLCAPTGSGKTNVAMLCMLHEIGLHMNKDGEVDKDSFKIIYVAPMKSLVQEMVGNFSQRLSPLGLTVKELSGDVNLTKQQIGETQIIVTTPEKWDIITRKTGDRSFTSLVKLIVIDEIHLLHDSRGPVLEALVSRTIRQVEQTQEMVRVVGLSATLPNYNDVALFLRVDPKNVFAFDNSYRPVPLEQTYIGIAEKKALKRMQMMNEITYEKVMEQAGIHQVLVFVHSRKETGKTARAIRDLAVTNDTINKFLASRPISREVLQEMAKEARNAELKELLPYGFAIHHAGLTRDDRSLVEDLFADKHIQVLFSTSTLAWGVNLPAHTVIIKGTQIYNPERGRWVELSPLDIMQMIGRAGRPQHDTEGEGMVITTHSELQYYLSLLNHQLPIESQFIARLVDNLNAEIVLGNVQNLREGVTWLRYTYLYICMLRNPMLYSISPDTLDEDKTLEQRRADLIHTAAVILDKNNLIVYDRKTGAFQVTDLGRVASHYYISYSSMTVYNEHLKPVMSDIEIFRLFSLSNEFKFIPIREEEKKELEKLLDRVPIPVKESLEEPTAKVNVLLQAYISKLKLEGFALLADMVYVTQSAERISRALLEIVMKRGWAQATERILNLCKMIERRMWLSQTPLRQFSSLSEEIIKRIEKKDFAFQRLYDLNSQDLGELVKAPQQGKSLHRIIHTFPKLDLAVSVQPVTRSLLRVELVITADFNFDSVVHGNALAFWVLVEDGDGEQLLHSEYFLLKAKYATDEHLLSFFVPIFEPLPPQYFVRVVSDRWLGSETTIPISFRHLILPEKYPPHTELLDLQPLPISALQNPEYTRLYEKRGSFNPIQTQSFSALFNTDDNVLVAAPTASGKTVCAEFAILRRFTQAKGECARIVYISPIPAVAKQRLHDWEKFTSLGRTVAEITGDAATDIKLLDKTDIVISTPEKWDVLSRRWKQRKVVQNVRLLIADDVHLIGGENGHIFEVIISRMRYITSQTESKIRIVALSTSLANAKDLGGWIGTSAQSMFNFHPNVRPLPLEIHIQGFDNSHYAARMLAMSKPTLQAVKRHAAGKPVVIFVPSKKQAHVTARDLITFSDLGDPERAFLKVPPEDIMPLVSRVKTKVLKEALLLGIGFLHEGVPEVEQEVVNQLFETGAIQVLVASYKYAWGMNVSAHTVIIMGTQYYNGKEHRYVDYPITDILQMMGRAGRHLVDNSGKCILLCHAPVKEFYKKFLYEPLPIESHLDRFLADHLNAEIVTKTVENKQDAVDYLTWTFMYRRLTQNPNYYNLTGVTHRHLSDYLSELIEQTLNELEQSKCIAIEDEMDVTPMNLGIISAYYYLQYTTVELFSSSLAEKTKLKGLIEILCSATEFDTIPVRHHEEGLLRKLAIHLPMKIDKPIFKDPHVKANVLLQAHFSRRAVTQDMSSDQAFLLENAVRLIQAMVDVISSSSWLSPALQAMELSQMITQAVWNTDPYLKQLPHLDEQRLKCCADAKIESVFDLMDMEDGARSKMLALGESELKDVALACSRYPNIDVSYEAPATAAPGGNVAVSVQLERDVPGVDPEVAVPVPMVHAPYFPKDHPEGWWLVVGDPDHNQLLSIKRLSFGRRSKASLDFTAPTTPGNHKLLLYFMSDSYLGCDQEYTFNLKVGAEESKPAPMDTSSQNVFV